MIKSVRVLQLTTYNEECGIAKYQEQFIAGMKGISGFQTRIFPYSPNVIKHMDRVEFKKVVNELIHTMSNFDILHIQHELSFFKHQELKVIIRAMNGIGKKVIVTVHTAPAAQYQAPQLAGRGPKSVNHYTKQVLSSRRYLGRYVEPLKNSDLVVVHNDSTKKDLISYGLNADNIQVITIPVPKMSFDKKSTVIKKNLHYIKGDIIFCTVGFLSRMKRVSDAIKALSYLPDNYKLAIIGGMHPNSEDKGLLDELMNLIENMGVKNRVYITGYIKQDDQLNALIRECDICVYPYDEAYYSYVSSAAINNAIANHRAIVAYTTRTFIEVNKEFPVVTFTSSTSHYELAQAISNIDIQQASKISKQYAERYSYTSEAEAFIEIYKSVLK